MTAAEVRKAGGQSAIYAMRRMIQSGWRVPGYATGGAVGSLPTRDQPMTITGPQTLTIVDADGVLIGSMRVAASNVVASYDSQTGYSAANRLEP